SGAQVTTLYDTMNRPTTTVKNGATVATYDYDPLSRRKERVLHGSYAERTIYTYDDADRITNVRNFTDLTTPLTSGGGGSRPPSRPQDSEVIQRQTPPPAVFGSYEIIPPDECLEIGWCGGGGGPL